MNEGFSRQFYPWNLGVAAKQRGDVPDPLHQGCRRGRAQISNKFFSVGAVGGVDPDFDEFVMIER
jgi:hypothetical protein